MPKPFAGPRLGGEIPWRWEKVEQQGPETGEVADALCHCGWQAGDRDAGCGRGHRAPTGTSASGPDRPAPYRLSIERRNEPASKGCSFDVSADTSRYHCPSQK